MDLSKFDLNYLRDYIYLLKKLTFMKNLVLNP